MGDTEALPAGPPVGRRPLPQAPQPGPPNRPASYAGNLQNRSPCPPPRSESMEKWQPLNLTTPQEPSARKTSFKREKPVITVLDARPMNQVGFREVQATSPKESSQAHVHEEPVKLRPPPPNKPPSSFRRSMPINMDKVGLTTAGAQHDFSADKPLPPRPNQKLITGASTFYTNEAFNDRNISNNSQNCDAAETRICNNNSQNIDSKGVPDIIVGQQINTAQRSVDLLIDVPPPQPQKSPTQRGVPVFPVKRPLPANRGPPPPLPKKSPSVPNLFTMNGEANWSMTRPIHIDSQDDSTCVNTSQPSPTPRVPRAPTIIRVPKSAPPSQDTTTTSEVKSEQTQKEEQTIDSSGEKWETSESVKSLSDKVAGGVRVFPFAIPKSTSEDTKFSESKSDSAEKPKKTPPMVKPKPALMPKPTLRPKPATASKPANRPQSAAFASSLKFAQALETSAKPSPEPPAKAVHSFSYTKQVVTTKTSDSHEKQTKTETEHVSNYEFVQQSTIRSDLTPHENVPKKGPMKATYRPTIIRAAVKAKEPELRAEEPVQEFAPVNKRLSSSCMNMNSGMNFGVAEFNNNDWNSSATDLEKPKTPPQPAKRQHPTIIRPPSTTNVSTSSTKEFEQEEPTKERKSVSFASADAETEPPKPRSRSLSGGIMKSAISMPDISGKKRGAPPPRPSAPPSRRSSRTSSAADSTPPMSPMSPARRSSGSTPPDSPASNKKGPPPRPSEGPKRPPRPAEGPKRRGSAATDPPSTQNPADRRASTGSPNTPARPGPGHPLFHYVAKVPHAVALFDYEAQHEDELSFKAQAVIELVKQNNAEWMTGRNGDHVGIFPASFVEVIEPLPANLVNLESKSSKPEEKLAQRHDDHGFGPRCRARFDYEGAEQEDLQFAEGDIIKLLQHVGDDWLKGELRGNVGIFPLSFVEIIEEVPQTEEEEDTAPPPLPTTPVPQNKPAMPTWDDEPVEKDIYIGTALHNFAGQDGELSFQVGAKIHIISRLNEDWLYGSLGTFEGTFPANFIDNLPLNLPQYEPKETQRAPTVDTSKGSFTQQHSPGAAQHKPISVQQNVQFCVVKFDFPGESEGDLALHVGDKVEILEHMGDEWLRGKVQGREGVFPTAFVEILSPGSGKDLPSPNQPPVSPTQSHTKPINVPHTEHNTQSSGTVAIVLHDFPGEDEGDLSLTKGEKVFITEKVGDEWLRGHVGDREGIFPAAFVEVEA